MLWFIHPDAAVRHNLCQTIRQLRPDWVVQAYAPDATPTEMDKQAIVLTQQSIETLPSHTPQIVMQAPQRLNLWLRAVEAARTRRDAAPVMTHIGTDGSTIQINSRTRIWHQEGREPIELTEKEIAVITYLHGRDTAVTREDLLRDVWLYAAQADTHTVETHMYRLRQKIERDPSAPCHIITEKDGYRLA